jgi:hypothetical protein
MTDLTHTSRSHHDAKGTTVTITDTKRFELQQYLRTHMETDMADTLMDYLPPAGWTDLARTSDIISSQVVLRGEIAELRTEMVDRFASQTKWFMVFSLTNVVSMVALIISVILKL